jgi:outer membrane protein insertion porin family
MRRSFSRLGLQYSYQVSDVVTFSAAANNLFTYLNFEGVSGPNSLQGIRTSEITPTYFYNTVDHPITPSRGKSLFASFAFAGIGGNTKFYQPTVEAKYFRPHTRRGNVIAMRGLFSLLSGYGGSVPPPFRRNYMGGENDIRGFQLWSVSPMAWIPDVANVQLFNDNGVPRTQIEVVDGVEQVVGVTTEAPIYRLVFPGGDTRALFNIEYRIKLFGPVVLAPFFDIGFNRNIFNDQVRLNPDRVDDLNEDFPQAGFGPLVDQIESTESLRSSTGVELQVMMPVVNAPFRFYWAYNPHRVTDLLYPPVVADRSLFPNSRTFINGIARFGTPMPYIEDKSTFRFTISRTF